MTKEQIREAIEGITDQMKGRLGDIERRCLHEDRKDLRKMLEALEKAGEA